MSDVFRKWGGQEINYHFNLLCKDVEVWSNDRPQKVTTQPWEETGANVSALGKQTGPGSAESLPGGLSWEAAGGEGGLLRL